MRLYYVNGPEGDINTMPKGKHTSDYDDWIYTRNSDSSSFEITFDRTESITSFAYYSQNKNPKDWGPIAGVRCGETEEKILRLGRPSSVSIGGLTKTIEFADIGTKFYLTRGTAYMCVIARPTKGKVALVLRFLHTLMP